ncbi:hypothetical protein AXF42_Ash016750 [Apostasia shenzhenica]|uniref:Uncharacterized protein n=1 Tax=Apostasia shenzhenica TaxID=1088818 RepID=A0A2I0AQ90_9ASPA|nr:hypothetical protein AXF42_Ash016750 [Apostasia shenzhenica]
MLRLHSKAAAIRYSATENVGALARGRPSWPRSDWRKEREREREGERERERKKILKVKILFHTFFYC